MSTLGRVEDLPVQRDTPATVVVDEASGTIVMGDNVRISTVAIAQGNLTVQVSEMAKQVESHGGFGLAEGIYQQMLKTQEKQP